MVNTLRWKRVAWRIWIVLSFAWALFWVGFALLAFFDGRMNWEDFLKLPLVLIAPQAALLAMWVVWRWGLLPLGRWIELDPGGWTGIVT